MAQDEVDIFIIIVRVNVADNEVDQVVATMNKSIVVTRPDLGVRYESVGIL